MSLGIVLFSVLQSVAIVGFLCWRDTRKRAELVAHIERLAGVVRQDGHVPARKRARRSESWPQRPVQID